MLPQRPKSREETPKEGIGDNNVTALQQYALALQQKQALFCMILIL